MKHIKKKYILIPFAIVLGALISWQLFQPKINKESKKKKVPLVSISKIKKGNVSENIELTGEIIVTNRVTIKTTVTGVVSYCPWREGDIVKETGELLIKIDRPLLIAEMGAKEASLEVANDVWSRKDSIQPSFELKKKPPALEIYKRLPGTNCQECGEKTCMAFALRLWMGETDPYLCRPIFEGEYPHLRDAFLEICAGLGLNTGETS